MLEEKNIDAEQSGHDDGDSAIYMAAIEYAEYYSSIDYKTEYPNDRYQYNLGDNTHYQMYSNVWKYGGDTDYKRGDAFKAIYNDYVKKFYRRWGYVTYAINEHAMINEPIGTYNDTCNIKIRIYGTWLNKMNAMKKRAINEDWDRYQLTHLLRGW